MGLDQNWYREKTKYTFERESPARRKTGDGISIPWKNLGGVASTATIDQIGYLRKANAIHGWIVREVAEGVDECQRIDLEPEHIERLLADIETALKNPSQRGPLEPTQGFFFGGYDKDDWYIQDLKNARDILKWIQKDIERSQENPEEHVYVGYYYRASW